MSEHTPFLTIFPGCQAISGCAGGLDKSYVTDVQIDQAEGLMTVCALPGGHCQHLRPAEE